MSVWSVHFPFLDERVEHVPDIVSIIDALEEDISQFLSGRGQYHTRGKDKETIGAATISGSANKKARHE